MADDADVIYVAGMARKLGSTEAAVRSAIARGCRDMPRPFMLKGRHAWRVADVDAWLAQAAEKAQAPRRRRRAAGTASSPSP